MKAIILVGYMCAGKTTVGRPLAKALGRQFYDLDWYIETRYRRKVAEIFAQDGEAKFRDLEHRMLQEVAAFDDIVLACGGGTPCYYDNMSYMNENGETIYLKATPETIIEHLCISKGVRPLLLDKTPDELAQYITQQLTEREPFYAQAQHTIDVNVLDDFDKIDLVVNNIRKKLMI